MREKDYIVIIGSANIERGWVFTSSIGLCGFEIPERLKLPQVAWEGISLHNLALLGKNAWLLSAVGGDFYGQSLLAQTNQSGVYVDKCLIVPGENTSSYLSLLDNTGEIAGSRSMTSECLATAITAEYLAQHQ